MLGSPEEKRTRPTAVKNDQFIITSASSRAETKMAPVGQSRESRLNQSLCPELSAVMSLVKVSQNNRSDQVQVWARGRRSTRNGEVVYWKLKAASHET